MGLDLKLWLIPFSQLELLKQSGEGSFGRVRGYVFFSWAGHGTGKKAWSLAPGAPFKQQPCMRCTGQACTAAVHT